MLPPMHDRLLRGTSCFACQFCVSVTFTGHIMQPCNLLWGAQERLLRIPLELRAGMQSAPGLLLPLCVSRVFTALPTGAHTADWLARIGKELAPQNGVCPCAPDG